MNIAEQRAAIVAEAKTWIGTPFHDCARVKGAGTDCAMLLYDVFLSVGLIPPFSIDPYSGSWHLHRNEEKYLGYIMQYAMEVPSVEARKPEPGDIMIWRFARVYSHGAIVVDYPYVIHAFSGKTVNIDNVETSPWLSYIWENAEGKGKKRPYKVFTLKEWTVKHRPKGA